MACKIEKIPDQLKNIYTKILSDSRFDSFNINKEGNDAVLKIFEEYLAAVGKSNVTEFTPEEESKFIGYIYEMLLEKQGEVFSEASDLISDEAGDFNPDESMGEFFDGFDEFAEAFDMEGFENDSKFAADVLMEMDLLDIDFNDAAIIKSLTDLDVKDSPFFSGGASVVSTENGIKLLLKKVKGRVHDAKLLLYKSRNMIRILESSLDRASNEREISDIKASIEKHKQKIREINLQIMATIKEKTMENVNRLYEKYEEWILQTLNNKNITAAEIIKVSNAINTWQNIGNIFKSQSKLDDDVIKEILAVQNRAHNPEFYKLLSVARDFLAKHGERITGITLEGKELTEMEDQGFANEYFGNLQHMSNKVVTLIWRLIRGANNRISEESYIAKRRIQSALKGFSKYKHLILSYDSNGKWDGGVVYRYSKKLSNEKKFIKNFLKEKIDAITTKYSKEQDRTREIKKAFESKNSSIRNSFYIITSKDLQDVPSLRVKLMDIVKDSKFADKLIADAINKKDRYSEERDAYYKKVSEDLDTAEKIAQAMTEYENNFSPDAYSSYVNSATIADGDYRYYDDIEKYAVEVPLRVDAVGVSTGYYDDRFYDNILPNSEVYEMYETYHDELTKYLSMLPAFASDNIDGTFVANVKKGIFSRVFRSGNSKILSNIAKESIDSITVNNGEGATFLDYDGKIKKSIPLRYLSEVAIEEKSDDLVGNLVEFANMAIRYKHLSIVEDYVNLGKMVVQNMKPIIKKSDGTTLMDGSMPQSNEEQGLKHVIGAIEHAIDTNLYDRPINKEEGTVESSKITSKSKRGIKFAEVANPAPMIDKFNEYTEKYGYDIAIDKMLKEDKYAIETNERDSKNYIKKIMDKAEADLDDGVLEQGDYDSKMRIYNGYYGHLGKNFSWRKLADVFITFGALKAFAYIPFPAMANLGFGWVITLTHAAGGEDFTVAEAIQGSANAFKSMLKSIKADNYDNNVLLNLAVKWGLLADMGVESDALAGLNLNIFKPMGLMGSTDFWLRIGVLSAMLNHNTIKDKTGKERKLSEAFLGNGEWNVEEFGENKDWNGTIDSITENKAKNIFISNVKNVNQKLHGNFSQETAFKAKRYIVARAVSQFRLSWLADAVRDRVEAKRFDNDLNRWTEGRYRTFIKFGKKQGFTKTLGVMLKLMAFQGESAFNGVRIKKEEKAMIVANMRKQMMEVYIIILLYGATALLRGDLEDDDSEAKSAKYIALNTANRILTDMTFFLNPMSLENLTNNIIPALGILTDGARFINSIEKYSDDDPYWNGDKVWENFTRMFPALRILNTVKYQTDRELLARK